MPFDFDAALKDVEQKGYVQGGDRFKIQEGANRVRLLTEPLAHRGSYKGTPNFKWLVYVLDRKDGQVKLWFMPHIIFKTLRDYQRSEDFAFDEIPMPYDVTVNAKNAGTKDVEYTVMPSPKRSGLTTDEQKQLSAKKPIEDVHRALIEKDMERAAESYSDEAPPPFDPDSIPT